MRCSIIHTYSDVAFLVSLVLKKIFIHIKIEYGSHKVIYAKINVKPTDNIGIVHN